MVLSGFTNVLTEEKAGSQAQRVRRSYDCGREIYESVGNFVRNFFYAPLMAFFVASGACLSSREVVIKVCCKTCRIKTVGEEDLGIASG